MCKPCLRKESDLHMPAYSARALAAAACLVVAQSAGLLGELLELEEREVGDYRSGNKYSDLQVSDGPF
jgi:hypothetical protein